MFSQLVWETQETESYLSPEASGKSKESLDKDKKWESWFSQKVFQERRCKLTWWKYLCIVLYQQLSFNEILYLMESLFKWGSILVIVTYYFLSIFIGVPLFMITIFLGCYIRRCYVKVWKISPALQGFGYTIMILTYLHENVNLATAALGLVYLREIFGGGGRLLFWHNTNCSILNVTNECYPFYLGREFLAGTHFFRNKNDTNRATTEDLGGSIDWSIFKNINTSWMLHMLFLWIFIYLATIIGYEKIGTLITKFTKCAMVLIYIPMFVLIAWGGQTNTVPEYFKSDFLNLYTFDFWEDMLGNTLGCVIPGNLLLLGSYMSFNINVCDNTCIVQGTKLALIAIIITGTTVLVSILQRLQNIKFTHLKGFDIFFVLVPFLLDKSGSSALTGLWFFILIMWSIVPAIFTITGIIDTTIENFPMLMRYRICVCTFTNIFCFTISACVLTEKFYRNLYFWSLKGWPVLSALVLSVYSIVIFLHGVEKISLAYTAVYVKSLGKFWKNFITVAQVTVICLVVYKICKFYKAASLGHFKMITIMSLLVVCVCVLPILVGVVNFWIYGKSKSKDPNTIVARKLSSLKQKHKTTPADGQHELIRCEHNCLLKSKKLEQLIDEAYLRNKFILKYFEDNQKSSE